MIYIYVCIGLHEQKNTDICTIDYCLRRLGAGVNSRDWFKERREKQIFYNKNIMYVMIPFIWNYSSFFFFKSHFFSDCDGQPDLRIIAKMVRVCSVAQLCTTLCDPMDCSPPGSSIHGILQARILEGVVISSSGRSFQSRDWTPVSCVSCTGRLILYNWATWEAQEHIDKVKWAFWLRMAACYSWPSTDKILHQTELLTCLLLHWYIKSCWTEPGSAYLQTLLLHFSTKWP